MLSSLMIASLPLASRTYMYVDRARTLAVVEGAESACTSSGRRLWPLIQGI